MFECADVRKPPSDEALKLQRWRELWNEVWSNLAQLQGLKSLNVDIEVSERYWPAWNVGEPCVLQGLEELGAKSLNSFSLAVTRLEAVAEDEDLYN